MEPSGSLALALTAMFAGATNALPLAGAFNVMLGGRLPRTSTVARSGLVAVSLRWKRAPPLLIQVALWAPLRAPPEPENCWRLLLSSPVTQMPVAFRLEDHEIEAVQVVPPQGILQGLGDAERDPVAGGNTVTTMASEVADSVVDEAVR